MYTVYVWENGQEPQQPVTVSFVEAVNISRKYKYPNFVLVSIADPRMVRYHKRRLPAVSASEINTNPVRNSKLGLERFLP